MSEKNEKKKRAPMIHTEKLFGGDKTAEEIYQEIAVGKKCFACQTPGITKLATLVSYKDLVEKRPFVIRAIMAGKAPGTQPPIIKTKYGPMICVSEVVACKGCTPEAERAAAQGERELERAGLTCTVEIRRGPGVDKIVKVNPGIPEAPLPDAPAVEPVN